MMRSWGSRDAMDASWMRRASSAGSCSWLHSVALESIDAAELLNSNTQFFSIFYTQVCFGRVRRPQRLIDCLHWRAEIIGAGGRQLGSTLRSRSPRKDVDCILNGDHSLCRKRTRAGGAS
jgi:hypothetical protein